jgi:hypothetical protein
MVNQFVMALKYYRETVPENFGKPWVLFIIEEVERNTVDQKIIEAELSFKHNIYSMRATFADIDREAKLDADTGALFFRGKEIGLVYYRTGYSIEQYMCNDEERAQGVDKWKARELLESAMPIKLPSIDYQLTTFKKFQQALSDRALLLRVT